ncbi:MAG: hypothetical protein VB133_16035 [Anaeromusa sp.]|uniref:hypothetical protein n=1 Tax=Anaeromusa sp. TaxID=1872520 RepID=UPI002B213D46|nr:hypothetical protein [Anaeromusa sp.]MEA4836616.1 hypothetical protein [Anaeromusa sp.]
MITTETLARIREIITDIEEGRLGGEDAFSILVFIMLVDELKRKGLLAVEVAAS